MRKTILGFLIGGCLTSALAGSLPHYQLAHKFVLGGEGGWDYLTFDTPGQRLFISRATRVQVMDTRGKLLGEIPGTDGVHGIALARKSARVSPPMVMTTPSRCSISRPCK